MGRKPKEKKDNINNLLLVCNVASQNNAIFCSAFMGKGRKELVPSRGKHNMDVMTSVTSMQASNSEELLGCFFRAIR